MQLHFGKKAEEEGMLLDFAAMKREYERYELWNPQNRLRADYAHTDNQETIQRITSHLIDKTKNSRAKFDFQ